jgi:transposase
MLLRHGLVYPAKTTWTRPHRTWLSRQAFPEPVSDLAFADLLAAVDGLSARKAALAERISGLAVQGPWWPTVARLRAFRAIDTLTALAIHLELAGDWQRFARPRSLGMWLGLTPSLEQSGESSRSGSITKTGSTLARRLLVEAAWHYARPPRIGATLANRQAGQPDHILQIANRAQQRP